MCPLPFGQRVLIADPRHQVPKASDPGPGLLCVRRHQVEGLHVVSVIHGETAGRVEAAIRLSMEDVWLTAFRHLIERIDGDWSSEKRQRIDG